MATRLFLDEANQVDSGTFYPYLNHTGDPWTDIAGSSVNYLLKALATTRGTANVTSVRNTVAGPTSGIEVLSSASGVPTLWCSKPLAAGVTISGTITLNLWAVESNMSANVAINARILRVQPNGTITEIAKTTRTTEVAITTPAVNNFTVTPTSTAFSRGDRIIVSVFGDDAGTMASGFTFSFLSSGPTAGVSGDSWVEFNETITFESDPAGSTVYLTNTASAVSTSAVDREAWTSRGGGVQTDVTNTAAGPTSPIQVTDTAGGTVVDWFTRPLAAMTLSGPVLVNLRGLVSSILANATLMCEIARVDGDGSNPVVWGTNGHAGADTDGFNELTASEVATRCWISGDDLAITDGQRLRIRLYIDDAYGTTVVTLNSMASGQTVTTHYAGTSGGASGDTFLTFSQTLTEFVAQERVPKQRSISQLLAH